MSDLIITKVDTARRLLAEARDAPAAKQVVDLAQAAKTYARRQKLSQEVIDYAHAVMVDAMTLLGKMLKAAPKAKGTRGQLKGRDPSGGTKKVLPENDAPTQQEALGEDGRKLASDAQALVELRETAPEVHKEVRDNKLSVRAGAARVRQAKKKAEKEKTKAEAALSAKAQSDSRWQVDEADCLDWFRARPADSVHLVFGSPPYEQARLYLEGGEDRGIARGTDEWVAWMVEVYKAALRCCNGLVAFVVEGQTKNYRWSAAPALLMADLCRAGIHLRKPPVYRRVGIPGSGGPDWLRNDYEFIVCATRGGELPWSDNTAMGAPPVYEPGGDPSHRRRDGGRVNSESGPATMKERGNVGHHRARYQAGSAYAPPAIANPGNVIDCKAGGGNMGDALAHENEAPFPEALAEFFVRSFCPEGGVVCDPFCGSGTTAAVSLRHNRRFAGCDVRASQAELSRRRISRVQPFLPAMEAL